MVSVGLFRVSVTLPPPLIQALPFNRSGLFGVDTAMPAPNSDRP